MQKACAKPIRLSSGEISVGSNECRLGRDGDRLVARQVLSDLVVAIHVSPGRFAGMLRFAGPLAAPSANPSIEAICSFAEDSLSLVLESIQSLGISSSDISIYIIGSATLLGEEPTGNEKQIEAVIEHLLQVKGISVSGRDIGGNLSRSIWFDASSGRIIVRTSSAVPLTSRQIEPQRGGTKLQLIAS